ncbi:MAG: hypothetical protein ACXWRE_01995 [Pseudobdellovibrionaceae bacterium]
MKCVIKRIAWALAVVLIGFKAGALPKASDFKEVGEDSPEIKEVEEKSSNPPVLSSEEAILSGTVRVIRKIDMTEAFFKDLKDSYFIPSGSKYSSIYKALDESMKKGTAVSFKANTKSRRILSVEMAPLKSPETSQEKNIETKSSLPSNGSK